MIEICLHDFTADSYLGYSGIGRHSSTFADGVGRLTDRRSVPIFNPFASRDFRRFRAVFPESEAGKLLIDVGSRWQV
ncbi:MAG: hypothetical protein DWQ34_19005 [Planctomycetota bacterium]|nr:MAG: hypothetical protein DWQ29_08710 [Planctomycetota bacterium]REJ89613.1 MAG: hypothetical protein DWQ34_19005 [Planctomycetota bacterium]REK24324.1 MAG: hypothetical protein DWQ41_14975 [Planctomycetota bacterium]REK34639.1 MAG: hypothetical protein DWQ45_13150 [Planctomycetota bacterium]